MKLKSKGTLFAIRTRKSTNALTREQREALLAKATEIYIKKTSAR